MPWPTADDNAPSVFDVDGITITLKYSLKTMTIGEKRALDDYASDPLEGVASMIETAHDGDEQLSLEDCPLPFMNRIAEEMGRVLEGEASSGSATN